MATGTLWLIVFLVLATASLAGIFLYGWYRRKEEMPDVPPLPPEDDDDWKPKNRGQSPVSGTRR